ncbi:MAG: hypothetical protein JST54_34745 [Deltaproteobacteria bacterium]|nr:hypothetical protein [Deltaproteobacteria bacterium]
MKRASILAALLFAGCSGGGDSTDAGNVDAGQLVIEPKLSSIQAGVFRTGCAVSTCHDSGSHQGNLVMTDAATSFAHLVNQPAFEVAALVLPDGGMLESAPGSGLFRENICDGFTDGGAPPTLVIPGDPDHSFLIWKLTGHDATGAAMENTRDCSEMPKIAGAQLPQSQIDAIKQWITNGAQND